MLCSMELVRIRVCHMQSFPIIIVISKVLKWHRLRHYMAVSVEHLCFGIKPEKLKCLAHMCLDMQKNKYGSFGII